MLKGPAEVADRTEIEKADFQLARCVGWPCRRGNGDKRDRRDEDPFFQCELRVDTGSGQGSPACATRKPAAQRKFTIVPRISLQLNPGYGAHHE
jgi:hypothetical protein